MKGISTQASSAVAFADRAGHELGFGQNGKVLIIDDDPTARLALAAMLGPDEYTVSFATDAADVRKRMALIEPDVVLCDLVMKEMCGDEFMRWMQGHARWRMVPVIAITRLDNRIVRADLLLSGADSVLLKPCDGHELRAQVHAALRTRRKYLQLASRRPAVRVLSPMPITA